MRTAETIFWCSLSVVVYVYIGYPLLLMIWRRAAGRPVLKAEREPGVTLVIAMHNESARALRKIRNCLALDYPREKLQIVVSLDAPDDGTEQIVALHASDGVEMLCSSERIGKAVALNRALELARGEIVVFADARQELESNVIRELVANFADPAVGAVSGELILLDQNGRESGDTTSAYWRYEKKLRSMESDVHSVPGATGAIYAIRRALFEPLPSQMILDDVMVPMRIVMAGWRAVFDSSARAYDLASASPEHEYLRKRRTLAGNYQLIVAMPKLLLPWRNPIFLQFVSHKVGRLVVPYCLAALFVSNLFLLSGFYLVVLTGQILWYFLAGIGWIAFLRGQPDNYAVSGRFEIGSKS